MKAEAFGVVRNTHTRRQNLLLSIFLSETDKPPITHLPNPSSDEEASRHSSQLFATMSSLAFVDVGTPPDDICTLVDEDIAYVRFHDFENLPDTKGEVVISPEFTRAGHKWTLHLYPGGTADASEGYVSLFLKSEDDSEIKVKYSIRFLMADGHAMGIVPYAIHTFSGSQSISGWDNFATNPKRMDESWKRRLLTNGTLTFKVRIWPDNGYSVKTVIHTSMRQSSLSKNILELFLGQDDTTDVAFKVKGEVMFAHRVILKAQAPELAEMCENCDKTNPMPVDDVEPEIFKTMLKHVYGENILMNELMPQSMYILKAAGKYGFNELKAEAESWRVKNFKLTVDNVISKLLEADGGSFAVVKEAAMKFILDNAEEVVGSESYSLLRQSPSLMVEVMMAMAKHISANKKRKRDD